MKVTYSLRAGDIWEAQKLASRRRIGVLVRGYLASYLALAVLALIVGGRFIVGEKQTWIVAAVVGLAGPPLLYLWQNVLRQESAKRRAAAMAGPLTKRTVSIDKEGVRAKDRSGEAFTPWSEVDSVVDQGRYCFIMKSPIHAIIIPKRAFFKAEDAQKFVDLATSLWREAHTTGGSGH